MSWTCSSPWIGAPSVFTPCIWWEASGQAVGWERGITLVATGAVVMVALISLVFIVGGYALLAALWYLMVYRPSRRDRAAGQADANRSGQNSDDA